LGAGGASEARGELLLLPRPAAGLEVEAARLRTSGSAPGRRSVRVRAVSSKSSPEDAAEDDSVELRAGPSDMAEAGGRGGWGFVWCGYNSGRVRPAAFSFRR